MESSRSFAQPRQSVPLVGVLLIASLASRSPVEARAAPAAHDELIADRAELDRDLKSTSQASVLWLERAAIQRELRDFEGALVDLGRAARAGASQGDVAFAAAEIYLASGDDEGAEEAATRSLKESPERSRAYILRAEARMRRGLFREASDDYGRALGLVPARPLDVVSACARALASDRSGVPGAGPRAAVRLLDQQIAQRGPLASLVLLAVEYERDLGATDDALERLGSLRATGWSEVQYRILAGDLLDDAGRRAEALAYWRSGMAALEGRSPRRRTTRAAVRDREALLVRLGGEKR